MGENKEKQTVFKNEDQTEELVEMDNVTTSIGLKQNLVGLLCYLFGVISGVVFLLIEKENQFVKYHAIQSIVVFVFLFILNVILTAIPLIGWAIGLILTPIYLILWVYMMWKAYQNVRFKLPIVSDIVENIVSK